MVAMIWHLSHEHSVGIRTAIILVKNIQFLQVILKYSALNIFATNIYTKYICKTSIFVKREHFRANFFGTSLRFYSNYIFYEKQFLGI